MKLKRWEGERLFTFVQYMDVSARGDTMDRVLRRVRLPKNTEDDIDYSLAE